MPKRSKPILKGRQYNAAAGMSLKRARSVTSGWHELKRQERAITENSRLSAAEKAAKLGELKAAQAALGGHSAYQAASVKTTATFRTSRYVFARLAAAGIRARKGQPKPTVLEIGAINTQLTGCPWLACTAMDLRSQHSSILQQDFLVWPPACDSSTGEGRFDVVVCAMVLNYLTSAIDRARMLARAYMSCKTGGMLVVAVPRRCIEATQHCCPAAFIATLRWLGFTATHLKLTPKVCLMCFERQPVYACTDGGKEWQWPWEHWATHAATEVALQPRTVAQIASTTWPELHSTSTELIGCSLPTGTCDEAAALQACGAVCRDELAVQLATEPLPSYRPGAAAGSGGDKAEFAIALWPLAPDLRGVHALTSGTRTASAGTAPG